MHVSRMRVRDALAAAVMSALVVGATGQAHAADRFVSTAGSDAANDCLTSVSPCRTVEHGLAQAASGDTVKVAGGSYLENLTVNTATTLTLSGGWAGDFSTQDPATMPSVLQAGMQLPVVSVQAYGITIALTMDGLVIQGDRNRYDPQSSAFGFGGGVSAQVSVGGSLSLALSRLVLQRNWARLRGGGLAAEAFNAGSSLHLAVTDSTVTRNATVVGGGIEIS